jgi:hypothetical protein
MNLTTTRAAQTACAEPGIALRRLYLQPTDEPEREDRAMHHGSTANQVQRDNTPDLTPSERLGLVLLGIGYDTSIA